MATLEEKVEERKKQAEERQISQKATTIAQKLGSGHPYGTGDRHGTIYTFSDTDLIINHDDYYPDYEGEAIPTIMVNYEWKVVYCKSGREVESYIPGAWEAKLDQFYEQSKLPKTLSKEVSENLKEKFEKQQREKAAKFGL